MGIRGPSESVTIHMPAGSADVHLPCAITVKKWFVNVETVKKMYTAVTRQLTVTNEERILVGYFQSELDYGNIRENSERVKIRQRALAPDTVTFSGGAWQNLANDDIIKGTVVVTDTAETVELTEGVDYEIDYTSGKIRRIVGTGTGGDAEGASPGSGEAVDSFPAVIAVRNIVTVHYEYFLTKVKDVDYSINYERGGLARKDGGTLVSGIKVYVDYRINDLVQNEAVMLSIDQAHTWILLKIGSQYEGSTDDNLTYAEAYLALYLISKMSAANLIYEKRNDDIEEAAKELKLISDDYRKMAMSYLADYFTFPGAAAGARITGNKSG